MTPAKVTPYSVEGIVEYDKLVKEFGLSVIDEPLLQRIQTITTDLHPYLTRKIFFAHRDMNRILDQYEQGNKFYLYTGRGPSGSIHLGHLMPWIFTKWIQDKFNVELWFQLTDDEKFLFKDKLSLEETQSLARENMLDIIALGFDPKKTMIFTDTGTIEKMYPLALKIAKKITFSMIKASFGLTNSSNIGQIFYTAMQAVPAILKSELEGKNIPCLIPHAVDQDPHFRIARDVIPKLGFYKPASIQCQFLPTLNQDPKMSSSVAAGSISTLDTPEEIKKKVSRAFTGGRGSLKEQKELGGIPTNCMVFQYFRMLFMLDGAELDDIERKCLGGELVCRECKAILTEKITHYLGKHQARREKARDHIDDYLLSRKY